MCPPHVRDKWPQEHVTHMSTVLKAIEKFLDNDEMTGQVMELSLEHVHFREPHPFLDDNMRWIAVESGSFLDEACQEPPKDKFGSEEKV
ncbi:hypothetical protein B0O99DRAFT_640505 [Bisporella sp. PMI_857]|nr:hypothetical protein B0O99DRAFT_640505 [Bisporella sp. PMI_857]